MVRSSIYGCLLHRCLSSSLRRTVFTFTFINAISCTTFIIFIDKIMNEQEKYLFDLRGYLVVKNALNDTQVKALSDMLDASARPATSAKASVLAKKGQKRPQRGGSDRTRFRNEDDPAWSASSLLDWGGPFIDLIDIPTIAPYLEELVGVNYRLDHDYMLIANVESSHKLFLHGGGQGAGGPTDLVGPTDGGQCTPARF